MPVYATRKLRQFAALLVLAQGCSQVAKLWLQPLDRLTIYEAALGFVYLLLALGLSGQSRFSLWLGIVLPTLGAYMNYLWQPPSGAPVQALVNIPVGLMVTLMCAFVLYRTRHAFMD